MSNHELSRRDFVAVSLAAAAAPLFPRKAIAEKAKKVGIDIEAVVRRLEPQIERALIESGIPSLTVALCTTRGVEWVGAYGYANLWAKTPAVPSTVYYVGSIYKSVTAAAVLQLVEQGRLRLDDPVRTHIPFPIVGEVASDPPLVRQLLSHTSGFGGNPPGVHHDIWGDTTPPPLEEYLRLRSRVEGPPLRDVVYSNVAVTLAGYLVQRISGLQYREYVRDNIFEPLRMRSTSFAPTPDMRERLAIPYGLEQGNRTVPLPQLKTNHYPAGAVYSPVSDLAQWIAVNLNAGEMGTVRVLTRESVAEMHRQQYPQFRGRWDGFSIGEPGRTGFGLGWLLGSREADQLFAHSGSLPGYTSFAAGNMSRGFGVALMSNRIRAHDELAYLAERALHLMGEHLV